MKKFLFLISLLIETACNLSAVKIGSYSLDNTRGKAREDRIFVPTHSDEEFTKSSEFMVGVFDGHLGSGVADFVCKSIEQRVYAALQAYKQDIHQAFKSAFNSIDADILTSPTLQNQGSTAVMGYVRNSELTVINTGDSKAIVFDMVEDDDAIVRYKTTEHKPNPTTQEGKRILACGGKTENIGTAEYEEWRTSTKISEIAVLDLAMSRAFGDFHFKKAGVIVEPEFSAPIRITPGKTCAIFASDGLWDVIDADRICNFVQEIKHFSATDICARLTSIARDFESPDDISVVVILF